MYLDNAATTKPCKSVVDAMTKAMVFSWHNPSSQNASAKLVREEVKKVRQKCAESIGAEVDEIFFTSGGSEGNNMILKGFHGGLFPVIISAVEHESIMSATNNWLSRYTLPVNNNGAVEIHNKVFEKLLVETDAKLISIMTVNNETGVRNPIEEIATIVHKHGKFFHTDAVQAYGHMDIDVKKMGIDAMTVSGHKINAPKGIGFVYISKEIQRFMSPLIDGAQENGFRGGTENVPGIMGLGAAIDRLPIKRKLSEQMKTHKCHMMHEIKARIPSVKFNNLTNGHPGLLSITIPGIDGEALQMALELKNIVVSGRSACSSKSKEPSHVLKAISLTDEEASSTIRVSFDEDFTNTDAKIFVDTLCECVKRMGGEVVEA